MHLDGWLGRLLKLEIEISEKCGLVLGVKVHLED